MHVVARVYLVLAVPLISAASRIASFDFWLQAAVSTYVVMAQVSVCLLLAARQ